MTTADADPRTAAPVPDWYPDPMGRHQHRYWDGAAWTQNVADEGVASIEPLETTLTPAVAAQPAYAPVAAVPVVSTMPPAALADGTTTAPRRKWIPIVVAAAVIAVALIAVVGRSMQVAEAKSRATAAIAAAENSLAAASNDAEPGTDEFKAVDTAKDALVQAKAYVAAGSWLNAGAYDDAQKSAVKAASGAGAVVKLVDSRLASARQLQTDSQFDEAAQALLAFAKTYPHSDDASAALSEADAAILSQVDGTDPATDLDTITGYLASYPDGYTPTALQDRGHDLLVQHAESAASDLETAYHADSAWANALLGKGRASGATANNFDSQPSFPSATELRHAANVAVQLEQPDSMGTVFSALASAADAAAGCAKVAAHPSSGWKVKGGARSASWSRNQVISVRSKARAMKQKLDVANAALAGL
jgi:hypothetical protein